MNNYERTIMEIAKPVINYLEKNFPTEHFVTCISHDGHNKDISTTITVKEEKEGKSDADICSITDSITYGLNYMSNNCKLLSYNKLMELIQSSGIDEDTLFSMKLSDNIPNHHVINNSH
jgi:hypothetical protein